MWCYPGTSLRSDIKRVVGQMSFEEMIEAAKIGWKVYWKFELSEDFISEFRKMSEKGSRILL